MKVEHTKIIVTAVAKNGSERLGANAVCDARVNGLKSEVSMFGRSKIEAKEKLISFLSGGGQSELIECEKL